jgi:predicted component of type VI protein secretion system
MPAYAKLTFADVVLPITTRFSPCLTFEGGTAALKTAVASGSADAGAVSKQIDAAVANLKAQAAAAKKGAGKEACKAIDDALAAATKRAQELKGRASSGGAEGAAAALDALTAEVGAAAKKVAAASAGSNLESAVQDFKGAWVLGSSVACALVLSCSTACM